MLTAGEDKCVKIWDKSLKEIYHININELKIFDYFKKIDIYEYENDKQKKQQNIEEDFNVKFI